MKKNRTKHASRSSKSDSSNLHADVLLFSWAEAEWKETMTRRREGYIHNWNIINRDYNALNNKAPCCEQYEHSGHSWGIILCGSVFPYTFFWCHTKASLSNKDGEYYILSINSKYKKISKCFGIGSCNIMIKLHEI